MHVNKTSQRSYFSLDVFTPPNFSHLELRSISITYVNILHFVIVDWLAYFIHIYQHKLFTHLEQFLLYFRFRKHLQFESESFASLFLDISYTLLTLDFTAPMKLTFALGLFLLHVCIVTPATAQ